MAFKTNLVTRNSPSTYVKRQQCNAKTSRPIAATPHKRASGPFLDAETEAMLVSRWHAHKDPLALDRLVASFQGLVHRVARQHLGYGLPLEDLVSEGNVGLMHAIERFDPTRGFRLSTYAMWWIRAGISEFVINTSSLVRGITTESHKRLFFNLQRLKIKFGATDGGELPDSAVTAIATELDVSTADVVRVNQWFNSKELSINAPLRAGDDGTSEWQDILADPAQDHEVQMLQSDELRKRRALVRDAMDVLDTRERRIVVQRHLKDKPRKLCELGEELGVSRERVRQIEVRALDKLRKRIKRALREQEAATIQNKT
ncbi:MAG: RNA polymerase factor sigma-32 [Rhodospirillales bacterium]|nr:RNA polymerase factor sigma-32 [Rhodospirillales bacterium]